MNEKNDFKANYASLECIHILPSIKKKFFCCYSSISAEDLLKCSLWDDQKHLLDNTLHSSLNIKYPVKRTYQIAFLKKFIITLETGNHEVHDCIYEELCKLQALPDDIKEHNFKHYIISKPNIIFSLRENKSFVSNGTTGLCTWQASLAMSNWILKNSEYIKYKKVLELGSGTGLLSFIASKCCEASQVVLTDGSLEVMKLLNENLKRNFMDAQVLNKENYLSFNYNNREIGTLLLQWEEVTISEIEKIIQPDVILAADVVYDNSIFIPLLNTLDYIFNKCENKCKLLLASTIRNEKTLKEFYDVLVKNNFHIERRNQCELDDKELCCDESHVDIVVVYRNKI